MNSPKAMIFFSVWPASSRVGLNTKAWILQRPPHLSISQSVSHPSVSQSVSPPSVSRSARPHLSIGQSAPSQSVSQSICSQGAITHENIYSGICLTGCGPFPEKLSTCYYIHLTKQLSMVNYSSVPEDPIRLSKSSFIANPMRGSDCTLALRTLCCSRSHSLRESPAALLRCSKAWGGDWLFRQN